MSMIKTKGGLLEQFDACKKSCDCEAHSQASRVLISGSEKEKIFDRYRGQMEAILDAEENKTEFWESPFFEFDGRTDGFVDFVRDANPQELSERMAGMYAVLVAWQKQKPIEIGVKKVEYKNKPKRVGIYIGLGLLAVAGVAMIILDICNTKSWTEFGWAGTFDMVVGVAGFITEVCSDRAKNNIQKEAQEVSNDIANTINDEKQAKEDSGKVKDFSKEAVINSPRQACGIQHINYDLRESDK